HGRRPLRGSRLDGLAPRGPRIDEHADHDAHLPALYGRDHLLLERSGHGRAVLHSVLGGRGGADAGLPRHDRMVGTARLAGHPHHHHAAGAAVGHPDLRKLDPAFGAEAVVGAGAEVRILKRESRLTYSQPFSRAMRAASARLRAFVFPIAADSRLRTVPDERNSAEATSPTLAPSAAARSTSVSRSVRGEAPCIVDSTASSGSITRSPAITRRMPSARCSTGASLTMKPSTPESIALL